MQRVQHARICPGAAIAIDRAPPPANGWMTPPKPPDTAGKKKYAKHNARRS
ncbi:hypothetical protein [Paraburkholderia caballeronis]|uniref:hypothetical protein n=1 Tax=Paraburkholderia caballeronis TaxID=416943 RepID=UPI001416F4BF|nr:hypothetical protein [Paraburkholderia caballeronis]